MNRKTYVLLSCLGAFGALPLAAQATPITPSVGEQGYVAFYNASTSTLDGSSASSVFSTTPGTTVGATGSVAAPFGGGTLNYTTTATGNYGVLKAGGSGSITGASGTTNNTDYAQSTGQAYFEDSWIITGGTGAGTIGLQFSVDGSSASCGAYSGYSLGFALINLDGGPSSSGTSSLLPLLAGGIPCSSNGLSTTILLTTTFTFGVPLDILVSLTAGSYLGDLGHNISSSLDLSDTAMMTEIIVKDSNGNVIPFDLTTSSGAALFSELAPGIPGTRAVPEPASLALFGAGLFGFALVRRKRRNPPRNTRGFHLAVRGV